MVTSMALTPFSLPERIDIDNANTLLQQLYAFIDGTASQTDEQTLSINLAKVEHCDSAGIACLLEAKVYAEQQQKSLTYDQPAAQLHELAQFFNLEGWLFAPPNV